MKKLRISLTGLWGHNQTWDCLGQYQDANGYYYQLALGTQRLHIGFKTHSTEYDLLQQGVGLCRATCTYAEGIVGVKLNQTIYATAIVSTKKK